MKFALVSYGTRGDVEPCAALARELVYRGHEVCIAVPPDQAGFVEAVGLAAVPYGVDTQAPLRAMRKLWTRIFHDFWRIRDVITASRQVSALGTECWERVSNTLASMADGADLLFTGLAFEEAAANVAEYYDIPLVTLHWFPVRANGQIVPSLPSPLTRFAMAVYEHLAWLASKKSADAQRRELGLPKASGPLPRRISQGGLLEIQAYDEACFPGLASEWAKWNGQRPFVGSLTMELTTDADGDVASWISAGTPPIYFGFGSFPIESPADTIAMISGACAQLGERALICSGWSDLEAVSYPGHVKVVNSVNLASTFPTCRAVVHHGGAGTTAAGLRAGVPSLILSTDPSQTFLGMQLKRLKVGGGRRFSRTTEKSLVADLRRILAPDYVNRAREMAMQMTEPAASVAAAVDLMEDLARAGRVG